MLVCNFSHVIDACVWTHLVLYMHGFCIQIQCKSIFLKCIFRHVYGSWIVSKGRRGWGEIVYKRKKGVGVLIQSLMKSLTYELYDFPFFCITSFLSLEIQEIGVGCCNPYIPFPPGFANDLQWIHGGGGGCIWHWFEVLLFYLTWFQSWTELDLLIKWTVSCLSSLSLSILHNNYI